MALKKNEKETEDRTTELFTDKIKNSNLKEKKILTTFSIEPSFKSSLEKQFDEMGLGWASGLRFALKYFQQNFKFKNENDKE
jgi:hypothetical protein